MDTLGAEPEGEESKNPRAWAVFLVLLPVAFLGAAYFLFIEYVLRGSLPSTSSLWLTLRLGGGGLILLALVLAGTFGYFVVERLMRPLRLILRLAETGEITPARSPWFSTRAKEYHDLYRLLSVLVSQNKAGGRAMEEVEQLRIALAHFRGEITRTGQHGVLPEVHPVGPLREIGQSLQTKRIHLLEFFTDLRERVRRVSEESAALGRLLEAGAAETRAPAEGEAAAGAETAPLPHGEGPAAELDAGLKQVTASVGRLRKLGTVVALETARSAGLSGGRTDELLRRFEGGLTDLDLLVRSLETIARNGDRSGKDSGSAAWRQEGLAGWQRLQEVLDSIERRLAEVEER